MKCARCRIQSVKACGLEKACCDTRARRCEQEAAREERKRKAAAAKQAREVQQAQQQAQQVLQELQQAPLIVPSAAGQLAIHEVVQVHENPRCIAFSVRHPVGPSCLPSLISRDCAFLGLVEDLMEKTRGSLFDAVPTAAAAAEDAERPRKRAKKKQEYVPGVGTANYAFLIILYQA